MKSLADKGLLKMNGFGVGGGQESEKSALSSKAIAKRYDSPFFQSVETPEDKSFVRNCACHPVYGAILSGASYRFLS